MFSRSFLKKNYVSPIGQLIKEWRKNNPLTDSQQAQANIEKSVSQKRDHVIAQEEKITENKYKEEDILGKDW